MFPKIESRRDIIVIVSTVFAFLLCCIGIGKVITDISSVKYLTYISMMILSISIISIFLVRKDKTKDIYTNTYLIVIGTSILGIIILIASLKDVEVMLKFSLIMFPLCSLLLFLSFITETIRQNRKIKKN